MNVATKKRFVAELWRRQAEQSRGEDQGEAAAGVNVTHVQALILHALRDQDGTWDEITERTGLRPGTVSPRFRPLMRKQLIWSNGYRPGLSGHRQRVWLLTLKGMEYVRDHPLEEMSEPVRKIRLTADGTPTQIGLTPEMLRAVTDEQWKEVLGERMYKNMKGYVRNRAIMLLRLLTEGRAYLDDQDKKWSDTNNGGKRP